MDGLSDVRVVLIPGVFGGTLALRPLESALRKSGISAVSWPLPFLLTGSIRNYAEDLRRAIIRGDFGSGWVDLVGYSMGGLIAVLALADPLAAAKVRRVITFGCPFDGSPAAWVSLGLVWPWSANVKEVCPGSPLLDEVGALVADPARSWRLTAINGCLDPLAPYPQLAVPPGQARTGAYCHWSLVHDADLHAGIAELIRAP